MKIAVIGGSGFIGRHVVRRLVQGGAAVATVDQREPGRPEPDEAWIEAHLETPAAAASAAARCGPVDAVVWLAAMIRHRTSVDDAAVEDLAVMVEAPLRFLAALDPPPASLVYASSVQVYGVPRRKPVDEDHPTEPFTAYGVAKLGAEKCLGIACGARGSVFTALRIAFVYGPGQHPGNVIPRFLEAVRAGRPPTIHGDGRDVRDDVYVVDVARAFEAAIQRRVPGVFNVASGRPHTLLDVAEAACRLADRSLRPVHVAVPSGWVDRWYAVQRARERLGFEAVTSFDEGLAAMWRRER